MKNETLKKKSFIAVLIILLALISGLIMGYTTGTPKELTIEEVKKVFDENNLSYTDVTANAQDEMLKAGLTDCIIAEQDDMKIEFYNFDNGLATLFWTKLLRTRNYFNYSSYPANFRVFNPLYSTGVR